ncbi:MAG: hypothetical protein R3D58_21135 [Saprospiraceae bacterium]
MILTLIALPALIGIKSAKIRVSPQANPPHRRSIPVRQGGANVEQFERGYRGFACGEDADKRGFYSAKDDFRINGEAKFKSLHLEQVEAGCCVAYQIWK